MALHNILSSKMWYLCANIDKRCVKFRQDGFSFDCKEVFILFICRHTNSHAFCVRHAFHFSRAHAELRLSHAKLAPPSSVSGKESTASNNESRRSSIVIFDDSANILLSFRDCCTLKRVLAASVRQDTVTQCAEYISILIQI